MSSCHIWDMEERKCKIVVTDLDYVYCHVDNGNKVTF